MSGAKRRDQVRQQRDSGARMRCDHEPAKLAFSNVLSGLLEVRDVTQGLRDMFVEEHTLVRRFQASAVAVEQLETDHVLKAPKLCTDRRLGHAKQQRRLGDRAG